MPYKGMTDLRRPVSGGVHWQGVPADIFSLGIVSGLQRFAEAPAAVRTAYSGRRRSFRFRHLSDAPKPRSIVGRITR